MTAPAAPFPDCNFSEAFAPADRPRRVLVYAPLAYSTPHFETDLEIAQRHLDLGDEVELVLCDAELASCQLNPHHELRRCVQCVSRNLQGAAQLSAAVPVHSLTRALSAEDHAALAGLPAEFPDQEALRRFRFESFDAGLAVLSSLIDFARSQRLDTRQHAGLVHRTLHAAVHSYLGIKRLLAARPYDRVYIYNGRWSMVRSAVRASEAAGVPYITHERGSDFRKFALYQNTLPHDRIDFQNQAKRAWAQAGSHPDARALATVFFQERRQRVEKNWFSYTKQQENGRRPVDWDRTARRYVLFTSSEFELAAIAETSSGRLFESQPAGAARIAAHLGAACPDSHLWIRLHPNDKGPETLHRWQSAVAGCTNVTLIPPDAPIDSYSMLDGAACVLTFGSTMGIEATYWGRPSICADHSFYDGLDAHYEPASAEELFGLLTRPDLLPKPAENALKFGYFLNSYGGEFTHFVTATISDYEFKSPFRGRCLKPDLPDLRERLLRLHQGGDDFRAVAVARLATGFQPDDGMAHAVLVLSLLRLGALHPAVQAIEDAAAKTTAPLLEQILNHTAERLFAAVLQSSQRDPAAFAALAQRTGAVLARAPRFAAIGQRMSALASRAA